MKVNLRGQVLTTLKGLQLGKLPTSVELELKIGLPSLVVWGTNARGGGVSVCCLV